MGSIPGFIIVKRTDAADNWKVYHRSKGVTSLGQLDLTNPFGTGPSYWGTAPTSTDFGVNEVQLNANTGTFVAYLFAHDPAGAIQCGIYSLNTPVDLGWQPQWMLVKPTSDASDWYILDTARGWSTASTGSNSLSPNSSQAEVPAGDLRLTSTGFIDDWLGYSDVIYVAINSSAIGAATELTFTDNTDLAEFSPGDAVTESGGGGDASGSVFTVDEPSLKMQVSSNANWTVGAKVQGPTKEASNVRLYCQLDASANVTDLSSFDPGFTSVTMAGGNPYTQAVTFPATLPSGNAPDTDLPAGTRITTEVEATNASGSSTATSNTVEPA